MAAPLPGQINGNTVVLQSTPSEPRHGSNMRQNMPFSVGSERAECVEKRRRFH
jgi:hypothetical protein